MKYSCNPIIEPPFVQRSASRSVNYREIQDFLPMVSKNMSKKRHIYRLRALPVLTDLQ